MRFEHTQYGFNYGAADITRIASCKKKGWVIIEVKTPKHDLQIYITKTGKIRVSDISGEWLATRVRNAIEQIKAEEGNE